MAKKKATQKRQQNRAKANGRAASIKTRQIKRSVKSRPRSVKSRGGPSTDLAKPRRLVPAPLRHALSSASIAAPEHESAPTFDIDTQDELIPQQNLPSFVIVGIGASAGGLEAISSLLRGLEPNAKFALVVVLHQSPDHESFLSELLASATPLTVVQAEQRMPLESGHVYVAPPNMQVEIDRGQIRLVDRPMDRAQHMPIDHFFRSLAEYAQSRGVGIVLSGSASDGAMGLRDIKAAGGITIAQEPHSARYDSMPRAAIGTGVIDVVLTPNDIARELPHMCERAMAVQQPKAATDSAGRDDGSLLRIFTLLRHNSGVDFTHYKLPTIQRRLGRRLVLHKLESLADYVRFLQKNPAEMQALYQDLLIHVTRFFRDPESFAALVELVFPQIIEQRAGDTPIRIWVPGCSTGEEAFSLAIALVEFLGDAAGSTPIQIFATDVADSAVERARVGSYPENIAADVSPERLRRFFNKIDGHYRVTKQIRDMCIFARQDLTRDPPFSKLDLVVCRNVLIYLGPVLQRRLMMIFHYALRPNAHLMLGSAETIGSYGDLFAVADKKHKIYVKRPAATRTTFDYPEHFHHADMQRAAPGPKPDSPASSVAAGYVQNEVNRLLLTRFAPPGVLVDDRLKILQFRGHTGAYLEPAAGEASLDLLKMAREGLLFGLRSAITEARKLSLPVRKNNLRVRHNGQVHLVNLEVLPIATPDGHHFLILFNPAGEEQQKQAKPLKTKRLSSGARRRLARDRTRQLEEELAANRDYLQSMIQDLEAANEELQSANEEILSSNEELQSTNEELDTAREELQSTNEELNTVNEELQARNEELSRVNSDLMNLLGSVQIAIVMVSGDMRIRRFTPMAEKVLNLIPTDMGRPISDIKPNIDCPELEELIRDTIDTVTIKECECRDRNGRSYLLRIRPYKSLENRIDGAVLALFDVEESRERVSQAQQRQSDAAERTSLQIVLDAIEEPVLLLDDQAHVVGVSRAMLQMIMPHGQSDDGEQSDGDGDGDGNGEPSSSVIGQSVYKLAGGKLDSPELRELLGQRLSADQVVRDFPVQLATAAGESRNLLVHARRLDGDRKAPLHVLTFEAL